MENIREAKDYCKFLCIDLWPHKVFLSDQHCGGSRVKQGGEF